MSTSFGDTKRQACLWCTASCSHGVCTPSGAAPRSPRLRSSGLARTRQWQKQSTRGAARGSPSSVCSGSNLLQPEGGKACAAGDPSAARLLPSQRAVAARDHRADRSDIVRRPVLRA
eukprot:3351555-Prymnesium_polylepis.1